MKQILWARSQKTGWSDYFRAMPSRATGMNVPNPLDRFAPGSCRRYSRISCRNAMVKSENFEGLPIWARTLTGRDVWRNPRSLSDIDCSTAANDPQPSASFSVLKNPQRIPVNTPPVFPGLRPRIWPHLLRLVTKVMSDRLLVCLVIWFVWSIWLVSYNQTNQRDRTDQMNKIGWRNFLASR